MVFSVMILFCLLKAIHAGEMDGLTAILAVKGRDVFLPDPARYRARAIPKAPVALTLADKGEEQLSLL